MALEKDVNRFAFRVFLKSGCCLPVLEPFENPEDFRDHISQLKVEDGVLTTVQMDRLNKPRLQFIWASEIAAIDSGAGSEFVNIQQIEDSQAKTNEDVGHNKPVDFESIVESKQSAGAANKRRF
jgi:hypothetical protein